MSHDPISTLRDGLIKQLTYIDENRAILSKLYSSTSQNGIKDDNFFDSYISTVEEFLSNSNINATCPNKVFIGSQVSVMYEDNNEMEKFTICFPESTNPEDGFISFHSPVGRQLLLKGLDDEVVILTPGGEDRVKIKEIHFYLSLI